MKHLKSHSIPLFPSPVHRYRLSPRVKNWSSMDQRSFLPARFNRSRLFSPKAWSALSGWWSSPEELLWWTPSGICSRIKAVQSSVFRADQYSGVDTLTHIWQSAVSWFLFLPLCLQSPLWRCDSPQRCRQEAARLSGTRTASGCSQTSSLERRELLSRAENRRSSARLSSPSHRCHRSRSPRLPVWCTWSQQHLHTAPSCSLTAASCISPPAFRSAVRRRWRTFHYHHESVLSC